ncbi:MAG: hypothetical protein JW712_05125 [Dehalococcoidales bacterium]|nr:hypothetical protein [Dehalococcoidales bacterium]
MLKKPDFYHLNVFSVSKLVLSFIFITSMVVTGGMSCTQQDVTTPLYSEGPPPGPAERPLEVTTTARESGYLPGETIEIPIEFSNIGEEPISLDRFPPEIQLLSREWKAVKSFEPGSESLRLKPGNEKTYTLTWNQLDDTGTQVSPGLYMVDVKNVVYTREESERTTRANFGSSWLRINYPQGAMEKTIEVSRSRTVNGITITLERIELSAEGTVFHCFFVPPDGFLTSDPDGYAEYSVDGEFRDAGHNGWGTRDDGFRLIWGSSDLPLNPVPSDAGLITFTITELNGQNGPWEFSVQLE